MQSDSNEFLKDILQRRLRRHFDKFVDFEFDDMSISIMPVESHVPSVSQVVYDHELDMLTIVLSNGETDTSRIEVVSDNLEIIFSGENEKVVGIRVKGFSHLLFEKVKADMERRIKLAQADYKEKGISFRDVENRKISFFSEVFQNSSQLLAI